LEWLEALLFCRFCCKLLSYLSFLQYRILQGLPLYLSRLRRNGSTAGPLLRKLGLADSTSVRKRMLECYKLNFRKRAIADLVRLLAQRRFRSVNFDVALAYVPWPSPLPDRSEVIKAADEYHAANQHKAHYRKPDLTGLMPHLKTGSNEEGELTGSHYLAGPEKEDDSSFRHVSMLKPIVASSANMTLEEVRTLFLNLVRTRYQAQIDDGELSENELAVRGLYQSLDFAIDKISNGSSLCDWNFLDLLDKSWDQTTRKLLAKGCLSKANAGGW